MKPFYMVMDKEEFDDEINKYIDKETTEDFAEEWVKNNNRPYVLLEITNAEVCEPVEVRLNWRGL